MVQILFAVTLSRGSTISIRLMKPVKSVERAITNSSRSRDSVPDLVGGSGTTLSAAERTGRSARLMEMGLQYVDVIVERWQNLTGGVAVMHGEDEPART